MNPIAIADPSTPFNYSVIADMIHKSVSQDSQEFQLAIVLGFDSRCFDAGLRRSRDFRAEIPATRLDHVSASHIALRLYLHAARDGVGPRIARFDGDSTRGASCAPVSSKYLVLSLVKGAASQTPQKEGTAPAKEKRAGRWR
jgi:hypothetical protein